jgi:hypothetical protein
LRVTFEQTLKPKTPTSLSVFDLCLPWMEPYQNYTLRLPISGVPNPTSFLNVRACFIPMLIDGSPVRNLRLSKLSNLRLQPHKLYYGAGEVVRGTIHFTCASSTDVEAIAIRLAGAQDVSWSETSGSGDNEITEHFHAAQDLLNDARLVWRPEAPESRVLGAGFHCFPFEIGIPDNAPSTGRYGIQAVVTLPPAADQKPQKPQIISSVLPLFINGPVAPTTRAQSREHSISLRKVGDAVITVPEHCESYTDMPITLVRISVMSPIAFVMLSSYGFPFSVQLLKPGYTDPSGTSLRFGFYARGMRCAEKRSNKVPELKRCETVNELAKLPAPEETKAGLLYQFNIVPYVEASCSMANSPLLSISHNVKIVLKIGGGPQASCETDIDIFQTKNIPAPTAYYPTMLMTSPSVIDA